MVRKSLGKELKTALEPSRPLLAAAEGEVAGCEFANLLNVDRVRSVVDTFASKHLEAENEVNMDRGSVRIMSNVIRARLSEPKPDATDPTIEMLKDIIEGQRESLHPRRVLRRNRRRTSARRTRGGR